jgi:hypothetical protein
MRTRIPLSPYREVPVPTVLRGDTYWYRYFDNISNKPIFTVRAVAMGNFGANNVSASSKYSAKSPITLFFVKGAKKDAVELYRRA